MKMAQWIGLSVMLVGFSAAGVMRGCRSNQWVEQSSPAPAESVSPAASASPTVSASPSVVAESAMVTEVVQAPVLLRSQASPQFIEIKQGQRLQIGDTVQTKDPAMVEIELGNGLAFRLAGNAELTLQPKNQLKLSSGSMLTWIQPGQKTAVEIVAPGAIAGIRGTTAFVKIPAAANQPTEFFSWEGRVSVRLPQQTEAIVLKTGESVNIAPGEADLAAIRRRIERLNRRQFRQRHRRSRLLRGFARTLPTLRTIEQSNPEEE